MVRGLRLGCKSTNGHGNADSLEGTGVLQTSYAHLDGKSLLYDPFVTPPPPSRPKITSRGRIEHRRLRGRVLPERLLCHSPFPLPATERAENGSKRGWWWPLRILDLFGCDTQRSLYRGQMAVLGPDALLVGSADMLMERSGHAQ